MSLGLVLDGVKNFEAFFGGDLSTVNRTIQMMVLYSPPPPEWLRGLRNFEDLPRVRQDLNYETLVPHPLVPQSELALRARWIVENCHGGWNMKPRGFGFENPRDAVYFTLRWD